MTNKKVNAALYYQNNKEQIKEKSKLQKERLKIENPFKALLWNIRKSANKRGLECNITEEYLKSIYTDICPVLNIPIKLLVNTKISYDSASIDRLDNSKGYVEGNIVFMSYRANELKRDASFEEIEKLYIFLKTKR